MSVWVVEWYPPDEKWRILSVHYSETEAVRRLAMLSVGLSKYRVREYVPKDEK